MSQHNSNYSTTFIILILSKIFTWLNYIFHSIYSNTNPSSERNLPNNLFKHTAYSFVIFLVIFTHVNPSSTHINLQFIQEKKMGKRCYLHSVQPSYENNSCKPEIKYFTGAGHCRGNTFLSIFFCVKQWFTCVNQ